MCLANLLAHLLSASAETHWASPQVLALPECSSLPDCFASFLVFTQIFLGELTLTTFFSPANWSPYFFTSWPPLSTLLCILSRHIDHLLTKTLEDKGNILLTDVSQMLEQCLEVGFINLCFMDKQTFWQKWLVLKMKSINEHAFCIFIFEQVHV